MLSGANKGPFLASHVPSKEFEFFQKCIVEGRFKDCSEYWLKISKNRRRSVIVEYCPQASFRSILDACIEKGKHGLPLIQAILQSFKLDDLLIILNHHLFIYPSQYCSLSFVHRALNFGLFDILLVVFDKFDSKSLLEYLSNSRSFDEVSIFHYIEKHKFSDHAFIFKLMTFLTTKLSSEDRFNILNASSCGMFPYLLLVANNPSKFMQVVQAMVGDMSWYNRAVLLAIHDGQGQLPIPFARLISTKSRYKFENCISKLFEGMPLDLSIMLNSAHGGKVNIRATVMLVYKPIFELEMQRLAEINLVAEFARLDLNSNKQVSASPVKHISNGPSGIILGYICEALSLNEIRAQLQAAFSNDTIFTSKKIANTVFKNSVSVTEPRKTIVFAFEGDFNSPELQAEVAKISTNGKYKRFGLL